MKKLINLTNNVSEILFLNQKKVERQLPLEMRSYTIKRSPVMANLACLFKNNLKLIPCTNTIKSIQEHCDEKIQGLHVDLQTALFLATKEISFLKNLLSKTVFDRKNNIIILCAGSMLINHEQNLIPFIKYYYGAEEIECGIVPHEYRGPARNIFKLCYGSELN